MWHRINWAQIIMYIFYGTVWQMEAFIARWESYFSATQPELKKEETKKTEIASAPCKYTCIYM